MDSRVMMIGGAIGGIAILMLVVLFGPVLLNLFQQALPALTASISVLTDSAGDVLNGSSDVYKNLMSGATSLLSASIQGSGTIINTGINVSGQILATGVSSLSTMTIAGMNILSTANALALDTLGSISSGLTVILQAGTMASEAIISSGFEIINTGVATLGMTIAATNPAAIIEPVIASYMGLLGQLATTAATMIAGVETSVTAAAACGAITLAAAVVLPGVAMIIIGTKFIELLLGTGGPITTITTAMSQIKIAVGAISSFMGTISSAFGSRDIAGFMIDTLESKISELGSLFEDYVKDVIRTFGCSLLPSVLKQSICHDPEAEIQMNDGSWKKLSSLVIGDEVCSASLGSPGGKIRYIYNHVAEDIVMVGFTTESHPILGDDGCLYCYKDSGSFKYLGMKVIPLKEGFQRELKKNQPLITIELEGSEHSYILRMGSLYEKYRDTSPLQTGDAGGRSDSTNLMMMKLLKQNGERMRKLETPEEFVSLITSIESAVKKSMDISVLTLEDKVNITAVAANVSEEITKELQIRFENDKMYYVFYVLYDLLFTAKDNLSYKALESLDLSPPKVEEIQTFTS